MSTEWRKRAERLQGLVKDTEDSLTSLITSQPVDILKEFEGYPIDEHTYALMENRKEELKQLREYESHRLNIGRE